MRPFKPFLNALHFSPRLPTHTQHTANLFRSLLHLPPPPRTPPQSFFSTLLPPPSRYVMLCSKHLTSEACRSTLPFARWYAAGRGTTVSPPQPVIHHHPAPRLQISLIKLPGEAQKIDRIIEQFAINYVEANPTAVDHVDTAQVKRSNAFTFQTDLRPHPYPHLSSPSVSAFILTLSLYPQPHPNHHHSTLPLSHPEPSSSPCIQAAPRPALKCVPSHPRRSSRSRWSC